MSKTTLKIIHAPLEIAGQVGLICEFLRKSGYVSAGYNFSQNYLNYRKVNEVDAFQMVKLFEPALAYFDLFHFHNGYTFFDDYRDLEILKKHGKKMIMHHRGNDVRSSVRAARGNGYENPYVNTEGSIPDDDIDRNLRHFSQMVSAAIVQDFELYHYVADYYQEQGKKVYVLPRLIDTSKIVPAYPSARREPPLIIHAPTNRVFKGSDIIEAVIERLKRELPLRYACVEKMSHEEALALYRQADIVIDQILCGAYGNLSVEAMAMGKPVVCYIRPDLVSTFPPDLPIVSANPDTLYDVLKRLVKDRGKCVQLGMSGRKYVERHHEASKVIRQLIAIYQEIMRG